MIEINDLKKNVPSLFAIQASPKMSERYAFVSTFDLIKPLLKTFDITQASQRATRKNGRNPAHTRHMLRMRMKGIKPLVGGTFPEVVITNSHDGQSRISLHGGLFRLVCSNGLILPLTPGSAAHANFVHLGDRQRIVDAANNVVEITKDCEAVLRRMIGSKMTDKQAAAFAKKAALAAYGDDFNSFDPKLLLEARREEDKDNTVWNILNRVQENITRGGVSFASRSSGRNFSTRGITHIGRTLDFNGALWQLAEGYAKAA